jgi:hypothetical protein
MTVTDGAKMKGYFGWFFAPKPRGLSAQAI